MTNCDVGRCLDFRLKHLAGDQEHSQLWETIEARENFYLSCWFIFLNEKTMADEGGGRENQ